MTAASSCATRPILARAASSLALIVLALQSDRFFTLDNLLNQGRLMAEVGLVALAMTFVIVTGGIDLSVGSILGLTAILLGVFWQECRPAPAGRDRPRRSSSGRFAGFVNGVDHHPLPGAAADRHAGDAGALSRPRRGHQPGALGARLSGMVLRARPGRGAGRADAALDPRRRRRHRGGRARHDDLRPRRPMPSAPTNGRGALLRASASIAPSLHLHGVGLRWRRWPPSIFVSRVSTTRSDMGTGLELDVITARGARRHLIFGGRGTIVGTAARPHPDPGAEERLRWPASRATAPIVVIGVVLIVAILISEPLRPGRKPLKTARPRLRRPP